MKAPLSSHTHPWPDLCDLCFIEEAFQRRVAAGLIAFCVNHPDRLHSAGSIWCEECNLSARRLRQEPESRDWIPHPLQGMDCKRGGLPVSDSPSDWQHPRAGGKS